jgi:hypothetical protein
MIDFDCICDVSLHASNDKTIMIDFIYQSTPYCLYVVKKDGSWRPDLVNLRGLNPHDFKYTFSKYRDELLIHLCNHKNIRMQCLLLDL